MSTNEFDEFEELDSLNLKEVVYKYLKYWPLYLAGMLLAYGITRVQLRYEPNIYESYGTVQILDKESSAELDLTGFEAGRNLFSSSVNLGNEIELLTSRRLMEKVVSDLEMEVSYYSIGKVVTTELWKGQYPFKVDFDSADAPYKRSSPRIEITLKSANTFDVAINEKVVHENVNFGDSITVKGFQFCLHKSPNVNYEKRASGEARYAFQYKNKTKRAAELIKKLYISEEREGSQILRLTLTGPTPNKNEMVINNVIKQFNQDGIEDKRSVAKRTEEFVNNRILFLVHELDTIESNIASYKKYSSTTLFEFDPEIYSSQAVGLQSTEVELQAKRFIIDGLIELLDQQEFGLLPAPVGLSDASLLNEINAYNNLVLERDRISVSSTDLNPLTANFNRQLQNYKTAMKTTAMQLKTDIDNQLRVNRNVSELASSTLNAIPERERVLRNISREQTIKESLYLFLLQKRESATLNAAVTAPLVKVVDYAFTVGAPLSPKRRSKYIIAIFIGLIVPVIGVYLRYLFDTKIHTPVQLRRLVRSSGIALIGEIPLIKTGSTVVTKNDRSELAESFRVIRTNINFMMGHKSVDSSVILFTSSTKSEGKTFTSINSALTFASSGKRTLLIGADLRNPQIHTTLGLNKNQKGLTTYLYDEDTKLKDFVLKDVMGHANFDVLLSGFIPPNPAELIMNGRIQQLIKEAQQEYDIIMLDCAPSLLVTDTHLLADLADVTVYMVKSGVTDVKLTDYIKGLKDSNKFKHMCLVMNGLDANKSYGYGYKYNYGYGYRYDAGKRTGSWKRFLRIFKFWK